MKTFMGSALLGFVALIVPFSTFAWVEYGAWYHTPQPYSQAYYQPMYAYAYAPQQGSQNTYINYGYPQQYSYSHTAPSYNYYPQYGYGYAPTYGYPQYGYGSYGPSGYGYPTGDTVPWIGGQLCEFPDYNGRALCGSNPNQWIYDPWTGSWY